MVYNIEEWSLKKLVTHYDNNELNLNPPYQRGDIWSLPAKKRLIESIKLEYPLPVFFLYKNSEGIYDMVDGQQRTRTIVGYARGFFPDLEKVKIDDLNSIFFYDYKIAVCLITQANAGEIEDFYYRVNKFGSKLNRPEILKAQFKNSVLQILVEDIASSPQFTSLSIFSSSTLNRLSDLDFIGELLTLLKYGITDKKITVDKFYEDQQFDKVSAKELEIEFFNILDDVIRFNEISELKNTRYKQRNDFYTLFSFLKKYRDLHKSTLDYFYKILISIDKDISPSQDNCFAFLEYANNCVSQSNSKRAREERLRFFEELLLNTNNKPDITRTPEDTIEDVLQFYSLTEQDLIKIENYYVINIDKLNEN